MRKIILITLGLALLLALVFFYSQENSVQITNLPLKIEVADTDEERVKGLSGRESLAQDIGLLFVFERLERYGIWMKNMRFPIDIAWLDKQGRVVHIEHDVLPETYPQIYYPPVDTLFVLETNSGFFVKNKISIGQTLEIKGR